MINLEPKVGLPESGLLPKSTEAISQPKDSTSSLADLKEAYLYDSLWLQEIVRGRSFYNDIQKDIVEQQSIQGIVTDLPTDTLKARLARINAKTPFNISYNPHLESVIKYFLKRRIQLIENMLVTSQFYFPLFEQELDNQNLPLELKYLPIRRICAKPTC